METSALMLGHWSYSYHSG